MALPVNDKKTNTKLATNSKDQGKGSKFIKSAGKMAPVTKKVRATSANRGS